MHQRKVQIFIIVTSLLVISLQSVLLAKYNFLGNVTAVEPSKSGVLLTCQDNALLRIEFKKSNLLRVTLGRNGQFGPLLSYALQNLGEKSPNIQFSQDQEVVTLKSSELRIEISKAPCRMTVFDNSGNILNQDDPAFGIGWDADEVRCWKTISPDEKFFGLGEKTGNLDKRGSQWEMWNSDVPGYRPTSDPIYQSIPFFIGLRDKQAYGIYFNNSYRTRFNMGAGNLRYYSFSAEQGNMDYFLIYGPQVDRVVADYTELTGRPPMWPRWALGYQQCRWSYFPESEVITLAETFRNKKIPADVIYLDIHYMNGYRVFTWDKSRFPNPASMLKKLRDMGFRVVTIIDPGVKADSSYFVCKQGLENNYFLKYPDGTNYQGLVWPGVSFFPDFSSSPVQKWWGGLFKNMLDVGVAGFWNDMNEPAVWGQAFPPEVVFDDNGAKSSQKKMHNLYGFLMAQTAYRGNLAANPNQRPFIITRAGFAGEQRFTTVWTGDNVASWEHLELGIRMLQGMGLSGISFAGMDVGGFIGHPTPELYARWIQVGAVSPFFRTHTEYGTEDQKPWSFGENIEEINRKTIRWRYQILPYLYSLMWQSHQSGAPIIRPMFWQFQNDGRAYDWESQQQFLLGRKLLVAPVTREGQYLRKLYLPQGSWMDMRDGAVYSGPADIIVDAPLDKLPVFLKQGGILPMWDEEVQWTDEKPMKELSLVVCCGDTGSFDLYEDDGATMEYLDGKYRISHLALKEANNSITLSRELLHNDYQSPVASYNIKFEGVRHEPGTIFVDGEKFALSKMPSQYSARFDQNRNELVLAIMKGDFRQISFY